MLDPKKVRLGMCPIGWSNDDMWDLGDFKGAYPEEDFQRMFQKRKRQGLIHRNISK